MYKGIENIFDCCLRQMLLQLGLLVIVHIADVTLTSRQVDPNLS